MEEMMTNDMYESPDRYESPQLEVIELSLEKGFAVSLLSVSDDGDAW